MQTTSGSTHLNENHCQRAAASLYFLIAVLASGSFGGGSLVYSQEASKGGDFKNLKYRSIGPAAGGRVCRVASVPGNPLIYYAATASGGVWKSIDGGLKWKPIFDEQPSSSAGSIAVAPSNPNVVYVGAGEANIRGDVVVGEGIYKSIDGGKTWKHVWKQEGQIGTMIVHPSNPDIAFAAVLGHAFGPNRERGVYRTTNGGRSWQRVLYRDSDTGASDVCFDPSNPTILFAGMWQARRRPWDLTSGGPGSGLYVSRDGGDTWKQLGPRKKGEGESDGPGKGLPDAIWGKIGVAVAPSDGRRVYALIEAEKGGLYRSDDGGDTWRLASGDRTLRQRAWYYSTLTVDAKNPDRVWCPQVALLKSIDGGTTFRPVRGSGHGDHHDFWIDPHNPQRMIGGSDGGVYLSTDGGESWYSPHLPISQFYHVAADNQTPYFVSGAMQDLGTAAGPSNSLSGTGISLHDWHSVGGGESGFTAPDRAHPGDVYAGNYGGQLTRYEHKTRQSHSVGVYPVTAVGKSGEELRHRFQWTSPILVSPHHPKIVYHASEVLFRTTDGGKHWEPISPDLTRNDKNKQKWAGGPITGDNTGAEIFCTIFAIAESPKQQDLIWAGSDDGLVQITRDGGKHWTNLTPNIAGLPDWGTVSCIETSPFDAGTAYVVVDAHRLDDMHPYLFKTADFGKTWKSLSTELPQDVYLHAVREDPTRKGMLYLGTERGVAYSVDDGASWQQLKQNLPTVPVHDLVIKDNDLVIGTHGRSIWIFDDLTPIRNLSPDVSNQDVYLFPAQDAIRYRYHFGGMTDDGEPNPPQGATLHYYLKKKPQGEIKIEIIDAKGTTVDTLKSKSEEKPAAGAESEEDSPMRGRAAVVLPTEPGIHRVVWDLTYEGPKRIKGAMAWPGAPARGPMAIPGKYTIKLTAAGKTLTTSLTVRPDPRVQLPAGEYDEQLELALETRDKISRVTKDVEQIRSLKQQLTSKSDLLKEEANAKELVKLGRDLVKRLDELEGRLHNPKAKIMYDLLGQKGGPQIYSQFNSVFFGLTGSDGQPTQGQLELYTAQSRLLEGVEADLKTLIDGDLKKLNDMAKKLDLPAIHVPKGPDEKKKA
jgi:photosystem II stability/assembly factor-like uncharacterized protein